MPGANAHHTSSILLSKWNGHKRGGQNVASFHGSFIKGDGEHETTTNVVSWSSVLLLVGAMEGCFTP